MILNTHICKKCGANNTIYEKSKNIMYLCWQCEGMFDIYDILQEEIKKEETPTHVKELLSNNIQLHKELSTQKETGIKYDSDKLQYHLLPIRSIEDVVSVLMYGANKYSPDNWKHVEPYKERYYDACMRHLQAWRNGEVADKETSVSHIAHAIACLIFILERDKDIV